MLESAFDQVAERSIQKQNKKKNEATGQTQKLRCCWKKKMVSFILHLGQSTKAAASFGHETKNLNLFFFFGNTRMLSRIKFDETINSTYAKYEAITSSWLAKVSKNSWI